MTSSSPQGPPGSPTRPAVDLADMISGAIVSQGPRPTCVPCVLAAAHEAERYGSGLRPAVEPVWWQLHQLGKASAAGTTFDDARDAVESAGHCDASVWPYDDTLGDGTEDPPVAAGAPPWHLATLTPVSVEHDGIEAPIEDELAAGHPVLLVIEVADEFDDPDPMDGYIAAPPLRRPIRGLHAVLIVGAWDAPTRGRVFLVRNSWGDWWGAAGYGLLDVNYLRDYGYRASVLQPR